MRVVVGEGRIINNENEDDIAMANAEWQQRHLEQKW